LQVVSSAAGQGITITGNKTFNNWNWPNAVIFAATVITTIGYGNIAPKTSPGRVFCIFYGLFGVPLCLTWISALGKFFGGRAKHLGQFLTKRGVSLVMGTLLPRPPQAGCSVYSMGSLESLSASHGSVLWASSSVDVPSTWDNF
ncbi:UNVERIFIED_CONTAM: hypothetical protein FKN15_049682, partial [Acipenser sinensis]